MFYHQLLNSMFRQASKLLLKTLYFGETFKIFLPMDIYTKWHNPATRKQQNCRTVSLYLHEDVKISLAKNDLESFVGMIQPSYRAERLSPLPAADTVHTAAWLSFT